MKTLNTPLIALLACIISTAAGSAATPEPTGKEFVNSLDMKLLRIEPGSFLMGNDKEIPEHIAAPNKDLKFGDIVALQDGLISYGKGYYKGAITVGVVTTGESHVAGQGPGVMAIASSKHGKIKTRVDPSANVAKYLGVGA